MLSAVDELDRIAEVCARLDLGVPEDDLSRVVLEPIAALIGAETASLRRFGLVNGLPAPLAIVDICTPGSVRAAYVDRYFELDPLRPLLARRVAGTLFADPEWSDEHAAPAQRAGYREDFRRYLREFLLPNRFYHHLGFCVQGSAEWIIALDFHRAGGVPKFGALERARARVVAGYLQASAGTKQAVAKLGSDAATDVGMTSRETEVAEAVTVGLSNKQIAGSLGISVRTVENHLRSVFAKCNVTTRTQLAAMLVASRGTLTRPAS